MEKDNLKVDSLLVVIFIILPLLPYKLLTNEVINIVVFLVVGILFLIKVIKNKITITAKQSLIAFAIMVSIGISIFLSTDFWLSLVNSLMILVMLIIYIMIFNNRYEDMTINKYIVVGGGIYSILSIVINLFNIYDRVEGLMNYANATGIYLAICSIVYLYNYNKFNEEGSSLTYKILTLFNISVMYATESRTVFIIYIVCISAYIIKNIFIKGKFDNRDFNNIINIITINILGVVFSTLIINKLMIAYLLFFPLGVFLLMASSNGKKQTSRKVKKIDLSKLEKEKNSKIIKYVLLVVVFIVVAFMSLDRLSTISFKAPELQERFVFIEDGINMFKNNLFGIGAGNFNKMQFAYQSANYDIKYVHNGMLQYAIDYGIIFIAIIFTVIISIIKKLLVGFKTNKEGAGVYLVLLSMIFIHSLLDFSMSFYSISMLIAVLLAQINISFAESDIDSVENTKNTNKFMMLTISVLILITIAITPYNLVYNYSIIKEDKGDNPYETMKKVDNFVIKDNRYYIKQGLLYLDLYEDKKDDDFIVESDKLIREYIKKEERDIRGLVALAQLNLIEDKVSVEKIQIAENSLLKAIEIDPYYLGNYERIMEVYKYMFNKAVFDNNEDELNDLIKKITNIKETVNSNALKLNTKATFMKNQIKDFEKGKYNNIFNEVDRRIKI